MKLNAEFLSLNGNPSIVADLKNDTIKFTGTVELNNSGDEDAFDVFPEISLGNLRYTGDPARIEANGGTKKWNFELGSKANNLSDDNLPKIGRWPVFTTRHYSDANGYSFSSVGISDIIFNKDDESLNFLRINPFAIELELGKGKKFKAKVKILNREARDYDGILRIWTSNEFLIPESQKISIPSKQTVETSFDMENVRGFVGSHYAIFVVLEYEENGFRSFQFASSTYSVTGEGFKKVWIIFALIAGLIIIASMSYLLKE